MARNDKERSTRKEADIRQGRRDVQLRESRRFFTARGSDSGVRNARALTAALGVGLEFYEDKLGRDNEAGTAQAAAESGAGGERSAENTNKGYNETWDRIEAINDLAETRKELSAMLVNGGWDDKNEEQVQAEIDGYYASQLQGINPESVYGQIMADGIFKHNGELLDIHRTEQMSRDLQDKRILLGNAAQESLELGTLDITQLMKDSAELLPGKGGRMTFMDIIRELAIENEVPELWDQVPDEFENGEPTGMSDPNFMRDYVRPAQNAAQLAKDRSEAKAEKELLERQQSERALAVHGLEQRARAGDQTVIDDVVAAGRDYQDGTPRLIPTSAGQVSILRMLDSALATKGVDVARTSLFRAGLGYGLNDTEYDAASQQYAQEEAAKIAAKHPDWDENKVEAETLLSTIERSVAHDRLPKHIVDYMTVTTASPERYQEAANVKRIVDEYDPELVQREIPDRVAASLDLYEFMLTETGGDTERALEAVNQYDETLSEGKGDEITKVADEILKNLAGDSGFWASDYTITERDRVSVEKMATIYWNMGLPPDKVIEMATDATRARTMRIQGVMYPANFGWTGRGEQAAEWFLSSGTGGDLWGEDADLHMEPHPRNRGTVVVRDRNAPLYGSGSEHSVADIEAEYYEHQTNQILLAAAGSEKSLSEMTAKAEDRAMDKMFPNFGSFEYATQEQKWASLTDEQRADAISAELAMTQTQ